MVEVLMRLVRDLRTGELTLFVKDEYYLKILRQVIDKKRKVKIQIG